jgi:hypothetical protein
MARKGLLDKCLDATNGDPLAAFVLQLKAERWLKIAAGTIDPEPDEVLPHEVWDARERARAQQAA